MPVPCFATNLAVDATIRAILFAALLTPTIAMGAGFGGIVSAGNGFRAGKYYNRTATIASLRAADLRHAAKADNIVEVLK